MAEISAVHVDIARLSREVYNLPKEKRGEWLTSLTDCLTLRDPSLNAFGAFLLSEVENFRKKEAERKRKDSKDSAPSSDSKDSASNHSFRHAASEKPREDIRPAAPPAAPHVENQRNGKREPDPVWDAICSAFHFQAPHPPKEAKRIGAVVRDLKGMGCQTGEEVRSCYAIAKQAWNGGPPFSPEALVKWWRPFAHQAGEKKRLADRERAEILAKREENRTLGEAFFRENGRWPWWYNPEEQ